MNQQDRLINYLLANRTIKPLQAWQDIGLYRLAAVIHVLRKQGLNITTETVEVKNRFNEPCLVANYRLES